MTTAEKIEINQLKDQFFEMGADTYFEALMLAVNFYNGKQQRELLNDIKEAINGIGDI
jgi:hypothetical protein